MASKRFLIVPEDSSAARIPRPGATMASATLLSSARFICSLRGHSWEICGILPVPCVVCKGRIASRLITTSELLQSLSPKHLDPRQRLALEPFEERTARCRDIGQAVRHSGGIERRDGVAAARDRNKLPGRREFR